MKPVFIVLLVVLALALVVMPLIGWAVGWGGGWEGRYWMPMMGFGWGWFMPLVGLVFLGVVIWAVLALVQGASRPGGPGAASPQGESALEILKRRYAQGEISKEEYEEKKRDIA